MFAYYTSDSSKVFFLKKNIVKKVFLEKNFKKIENEIYCLKKLSKYNITPNLLKIDLNNRSIFMDNVGERINFKNAPKNWKKQLRNILEILKREGIEHQDLKIDEILVRDSKIKIVDFADAKLFNLKNNKNLIKKSRISDDKYIIGLIDFYLNCKKIINSELHVIISWEKKNLSDQIVSLLPFNITIIYSFFYRKSFFGFCNWRKISFLKKFYSNRNIMFGDKGKDGFYAYFLLDKDPKYEQRENIFSKKISTVNKKIFDLKNKIRDGRIGYIHGSDNITEAFDNIKALTPKWGKYPLSFWEYWRPSFNNFSQFFKFLNNQKNLKYVVLRGLDPKCLIKEDTDVDLLVDDPHLFERLTGAEYYKHNDERKSYYAPSVNNEGYKVAAYIIIGNKKIKFDIRRVGDGYFCSKWQDQMLKNSIRVNNVNFLNKKDQFYSLLYHDIIHKGLIRKKTLEKIYKLESFLKINIDYGNKHKLKEHLNKFLKVSGYEYICPDELSIGCGSICLGTSKTKNNSIPHLDRLYKAFKEKNWYEIKDLSNRYIINNNKFKFIFILTKFLARSMLILRYYEVIRFKYLIFYLWSELKKFLKK